MGRLRALATKTGARATSSPEGIRRRNITEAHLRRLVQEERTVAAGALSTVQALRPTEAVARPMAEAVARPMVEVAQLTEAVVAGPLGPERRCPRRLTEAPVRWRAMKPLPASCPSDR